jgi:DNA-directed RNA polymerase sigma subunit (sigma70/sigma32)
MTYNLYQNSLRNRKPKKHTTNAVGHIMALMDDYPIITKQQEIEFAKRKDYNSLILHSLRLAVSLAKSRQNQGLELEDLVQEGIIGLIEASKRYDYKRNIRFTTFAYMYIVRALNRAMTEKGRPIRIPEWLVATKLRQNRENYNV